MKIIPQLDRILLKPTTPEPTPSGIYIPKSQSEKSQQMTVASVGSTVNDFHIGDVVIVSKYAGIELNHNNQNYLIVRSVDILAKLQHTQEESQ
jgi:chaperonin GroES